MNNKAYYVEDDYTIEEVDLVKKQDVNCYVIRHTDGTTNAVLGYKCFNSKEDAINKVLENLEFDVEQAKYELDDAQDNLYMTKYKLQKFREEYEI